MDVPEDMQEMAIRNDVGNIKNIKNLTDDLKEKYKHLLQADKFGLFEHTFF
jgi:flagellin-specific chaperone FliS